jgi:hypothetical protein
VNNNKPRTATEKAPNAAVGANVLAALESLAQPVGTFAGSEDLVLRLRNGRITSGDAGNQGGGQN